MLAFLAFCINTRSREFEAGSGPADFIQMAISLPILVNVLAIDPQRFIFLAFLYSNARPIFSAK
jgi:hypothetical protein